MPTMGKHADLTAITSMRIGVAGAMYPVPASVPADATAEWQVHRSAELGCRALQIRDLPSHDDGPKIRALRELAESFDIELETSTRFVFTPLGEAPGDEQAEELRRELRTAHALGMPVVRTAYGRLTLETSRYAPDVDVRAHLRHLGTCLRRAAKIAEATGVRIAVENHCDFTGREVAGVLADLSSEHIGAALDTANGFTVFCDPNEDVEALAKFTFTTHMKDMRMEPSPMRGMIPLSPRGCRLGDGHLNFPRALELLATRSPYAHGLHLLVESGWETFDLPGPRAMELRKEILEDGVRYLQDLTASMKGRDE
jgi:3-oxoisoapionate decarboxylase